MDVLEPRRVRVSRRAGKCSGVECELGVHAFVEMADRPLGGCDDVAEHDVGTGLHCECDLLGGVWVELAELADLVGLGILSSSMLSSGFLGSWSIDAARTSTI